jgi:hypothetical protein
VPAAGIEKIRPGKRQFLLALVHAHPFVTRASPTAGPAPPPAARRIRLRAAVAVFLFAWTLTTHGKYSASGDEPHYLIITHSILADGDMDLANNYAASHGRFFGHDGLEMGLHAVPARSGALRSIHDVGLAVALVPVYFVAQQLARLPSDRLLQRVRMSRGLFAYSIIGLFLIALTVSGLVMLTAGMSSLASPRTAALLMVLAGVSPPIVSHSFLVFPEALALFVSCLVAWIAFGAPAPRDARALIVVLFLAGALPWTHHKYLVYVPGLLFVIVIKRWALIRSMTPLELSAAAAALVLPQLALFAWTWREWGTLGGALTTDGLPFSFEMFQSGSLGLWLDRRSGLLAYGPLFWIAPACLWLTRRTTWPVLVPAALLYLPAAAFTIGWWAGFSPAARYILPLVPFLLVAIAAAAARYRAVLVAAAVLTLPQLAIDAVIWHRPRTLWPSETAASNAALRMLGWLGRAYESILPDTRDGTQLAMAVALGAAWAALMIAARKCGPGPAIDSTPPGRGPDA